LEIRGIRAKLAFVGRGALRNISLCEARFSAPPYPDNYCTVLNAFGTDETTLTMQTMMAIPETILGNLFSGGK